MGSDTAHKSEVRMGFVSTHAPAWGATPATLDFENVKFEIEGRKLVAILAKENEHKKRG